MPLDRDTAAGLPTPLTWIAAIVVGLVMSAGVKAGPNDPVDPAKLAPHLPAAWAGVTKHPVETKTTAAPGKSSTASGRYSAAAGRGEYLFRLGDEGAYNARMYRDYGADYLTKDVTNNTQKTLTLAGRRVLQTSTSKNSLMLDTFVADRWRVTLNCIDVTEAACHGAFGKLDFAGLSALKPQ